MHSVQEESVELSDIPQRLDLLRVRTQGTWEDVGKRIGLAVSMIYQVNRGERKLSPKALYRLEAAEIEVGIRKEFSGAFHCTPPLAPFARIFDNPVKQLEKLREAAKTAREFADKAEATAQQMEAWVRIAEKQHQRKQSTPSRPKKTGP